MRNYLLLLFLIIFFKIGLCQTNVYHPFPDSNAVWTGVEWYKHGNCTSNCFGPTCTKQVDYQDSLGDDIIIQSKKYRKIYRSEVQKDYYYDTTQVYCTSGTRPNPVYSKKSKLYVGAIRQDKNTHNVYFFPSSSSSEVLLYDFNLNIGDTLPLTYGVYARNNYVYDIDSVLVGGSYRKRFIIGIGNCLNCASIIEGIGSSFGLLEPLILPFEHGFYLKCVAINSKPVYPDTTIVCDNIFTGIKNNTHLLSFSIFPNPSTTTLTIETTISQLYLIQLINLLGEVVYTSSESISSIAIIDVGTLPKGIYIVQIRDRDNNTSGKQRLVIQ